VFRNQTAQHQEALRSAIGFTDADLKSNRVGRLSEQQRQALHQDQSKSAVKWWIIIGISAVFVFLGLSTPVWGGVCVSYSAPLFLLALPAAFLEQNKIRKVLKQGRVNMIQGVLSKRGPQALQSNAKNPVNYIYMEGQRFTVSEGVYETLDDDALYRLYYVEATSFLRGKEMKLLAAEWLDEEEVLGRLNNAQVSDEQHAGQPIRRTTQSGL